MTNADWRLPHYMSTVSKSRNQHRPTTNSSRRPRLYGKLSELPAFNVTAFAKQAHEANKKDKREPKGTGYGFGTDAATRAAKKAAQEAKK